MRSPRLSAQSRLLTATVLCLAAFAWPGHPALASLECANAVRELLWLDPAESSLVPARVLSGALPLVKPSLRARNGFPPDAFFITEEFLSQAGIAVPEGAIRADLRAYRYYDPKKSYGTLQGWKQDPWPRLHRGGGRDHGRPILPGTPAAQVDRSLTEKGSGINSQFSQSNGRFKLQNFRTNGLQDDVEVASEIIVVRQLQNAAVPVVEHPEARLAPLPFQRAIGAVETDSDLIRGPLAAQTTRRQKAPRDSFGLVETIPEEQKLGVSASFLFHNIGHGAINPENMARGMINDPGHVTFGYPVLSGLYRCVICVGVQGSLGDGSMVGILDYFFPRRTLTHYVEYFERGADGLNSLQFRFDPDLGNALYRTLAQNHLGVKSPKPLTEPQLASLKKMLRQRIQFEGLVQSHSLSYAVADQLYGRTVPRDLFTTYADNAVSPRFLMQLGALQSSAVQPAAKKKVDALLQAISDRLKPQARSDFRTMVDLFSTTIAQSAQPGQTTERLFSEYLPVNLVIEEIQELRKANPGFTDYAKALPKLIERRSQPLRLTPEEWQAKLETALLQSP